jgi:cobalt-zinc-cadmium efflux system outer membrane protein
MKKKKLLILPMLMIFFSFLHINVSSQDTVSLTIDKADSIFLVKNLSLLSAKYSISAAQALKIQAKVYPNPTLYLEQSLINKYTRSDYNTDPTRTGSTENIVQVNQLITLAGKRNKQIKLADYNVKLTETDFENLLRTLRFQLHNDFNQLYYNQLSLKLLNEENMSIDKLSSNVDEQVQKGFISLSEGVRIKSLVLEIDKQLVDYQNADNELLSEINSILNYPVGTYIRVKTPPNLSVSLLPVNNYLDSANRYNPDVKKSSYLIDIAKAQYNLNKAMAIPNANLQLTYDKSGNYIKNYYGIGVGIDLPTFNRNQGNIKASEFQISQTENDLKLQQQSVASLLFSVYQNSVNYQNTLKNYTKSYEAQLLQMMDNVFENYQKRIITLVDFTSYYESYKQSYLSLLQIRSSLVSNIEQLNFLIGKPIIK